MPRQQEEPHRDVLRAMRAVRDFLLSLGNTVENMTTPDDNKDANGLSGRSRNRRQARHSPYCRHDRGSVTQYECFGMRIVRTKLASENTCCNIQDVQWFFNEQAGALVFAPQCRC